MSEGWYLLCASAGCTDVRNFLHRVCELCGQLERGSAGSGTGTLRTGSCVGNATAACGRGASTRKTRLFQGTARSLKLARPLAKPRAQNETWPRPGRGMGGRQAKPAKRTKTSRQNQKDRPSMPSMPRPSQASKPARPARKASPPSQEKLNQRTQS